MEAKHEKITEVSLRELVDRFYAAVRRDALLAPVFDAAIGTTDEEWQPHLELITSFWAAVMLGTGGYTGNPLKAHRGLPPFDALLFGRWLALFANTVHETHDIAPATLLIRKSVSMAEAMSRDLYGAPLGAPAMPVMPPALQHFRSTPVFETAGIPDALRRAHKTAAGVFARIAVAKGRLLYTIGREQTHILTASCAGIIEPDTLHFVTPLDDVEFAVEFYRQAS